MIKGQINIKVNIYKFVFIVIIFISLTFYFLKCYLNYSYQEKNIEFLNQIEINNVKINSQIKNRLLERFDINFYDSLRKEYGHHRKDRDFLVCNMLVSNKWNYNYASYSVFETFSDLDLTNKDKEVPSLEHLDDLTKDVALKYLVKASDLKSPNAMNILGHYYVDGIYVKKDKIIGEKLINESGME